MLYRYSNFDKCLQNIVILAFIENIFIGLRKEAKMTKNSTVKADHPISLKKFPKIWVEQIENFYPGSLSDYILIAVAEKMERDNIRVDLKR